MNTQRTKRKVSLPAKRCGTTLRRALYRSSGNARLLVSGGDSAIGVVESAEHGRGDELRGASELWRLGVRNGRVAVEALMRPLGVIIGLDEFGEQPLEMALVQDDHVVEQFTPERADEAFDEQSRRAGATQVSLKNARADKLTSKTPTTADQSRSRQNKMAERAFGQPFGQ